VALLLALGVAGCGGGAGGSPGNRTERASVNQDIAASLGVVRQSRIFFSHHSVGRDLLAGLKYLDAGNGGGLRVVPLEEGGTPGPALIEGSGGQNGDPRSKMDFFAATLRDHPQLHAKLAFMKLCFVDFNPSTSVDEVFSYYQKTVETVKREHPDVVLAHVTVPLVRQPTELKAKLNRLLGRLVWEDAANAKRYQFNQRLQQSFPGDPIFDLAQAESTRADGTRVTYEHGGKVYYSLDPQYTEDGAHLNETGQRAMAAAMSRFMAAALGGVAEARR
jgi:hypothetical protein